MDPTQPEAPASSFSLLLSEPPAALDLHWAPVCEGRWVAPSTAEFAEAWRCNHAFFMRHGFRVSGFVVSWAIQDQEAVSTRRLDRARLLGAIARLDAAARRAIKREAEWKAARTPRPAHESGVLRRDLRETLERRRWAIPRRLQEAAKSLGEAEALTPRQAAFAQDILDQAYCRLAIMAQQMSTPLGRRCVDLAERAGAAAKIMAALRYISGLDADRATERNGIGWDAVHSEIGRSLAEQETIFWPESGAALAMVHRHRRQLPEAMRLALFADKDLALSNDDVSAIDAGDLAVPFAA